MPLLSILATDPFLDSLTEFYEQMSPVSLAALVFGILGVWLTIKQSIWCWPVALVAVVASIAEFYKQRLFGDMSLQLVYFIAGVYGWIYWNRHKTMAFVVTKTDPKQVPALIIITVLQSVVYYYLLVYFKGNRPFLDAVLTACSLTATYMMTKKWVENWMAWVIIDATYVLLYCRMGMLPFALLNVVFTLVAFYGWLKWRKTV